jgi:hypothetical protein
VRGARCEYLQLYSPNFMGFLYKIKPQCGVKGSLRQEETLRESEEEKEIVNRMRKKESEKWERGKEEKIKKIY